MFVKKCIKKKKKKSLGGTRRDENSRKKTPNRIEGTGKVPLQETKGKPRKAKKKGDKGKN